MAKRARRPARPADAPLRVVFYSRVSTEEQARNGYSLGEQLGRLEAEAQANGWEVVGQFVDPGVSASKYALGQRPEGSKVLAMLAAGEADVLAATKLDRTCRSVIDAGQLIRQSKAEGWRIAWLEPRADTWTPSGKLVTNVVASAAEYEADMASLRTREGMAAARAQGKHVGRRSELPAEVRDRIVALRADGLSLPAIARQLEQDGVLTSTGKARWYPSTVASYLPAVASSA